MNYQSNSSCILPYLKPRSEQVKLLRVAKQLSSKKAKRVKNNSDMSNIKSPSSREELDNLKSIFDLVQKELYDEKETAIKYKRKSVDLSNQLKRASIENLELVQKLNTWTPDKETLENLKDNIAQLHLELKSALASNDQHLKTIEQKEKIINDLNEENKQINLQLQKIQEEKQIHKLVLPAPNQKINKLNNKVKILKELVNSLEDINKSTNCLLGKYKECAIYQCRKHKKQRLVFKFIMNLKHKSRLYLKKEIAKFQDYTKSLQEQIAMMNEEIHTRALDNMNLSSSLKTSDQMIYKLERSLSVEKSEIHSNKIEIEKIINEKNSEINEFSQKYEKLQSQFKIELSKNSMLTRKVKKQQGDIDQLQLSNRKLKDHNIFLKRRHEHSKNHSGHNCALTCKDKYDKSKEKLYNLKFMTKDLQNTVSELSQKVEIHKYTEKSMQEEIEYLRSVLDNEKNSFFKPEEFKIANNQSNSQLILLYDENKKLSDERVFLKNLIDEKNNLITSLENTTSFLRNKIKKKSQREDNEEQTLNPQKSNDTIYANLQKLEDLLVCPCCLNIYERPCLLEPCLHVLCKFCIGQTCFLCSTVVTSSKEIRILEKICYALIGYKDEHV